MTVRRRSTAAMLVGFALLLACGLHLRAQSAASPGEPGSAVIRGRITAADSGRPLRRAQVTLRGAAAGGTPRTANTGLDGRYEFAGIAPGRYTVRVTRGGYLPLEYGQRRPLEPARPLQVEADQTIDDVDFPLPRAGSISGRVLDETGEPIAGVRVWAMHPMYVEGRRQLVVAGGFGDFGGTDDTGRYRVTGLMPGRYYLRATTRETWTANVEGVRVTLGFAPTFLPGTALMAEARHIDVGVGQQVREMDFQLVPARTATVSGTAVDSRGQPLAGRSVGLTLRTSASGGGTSFQSAGSAPVAADGSFTFREVIPGEYEISVSTGNPGTGDGEAAQGRVLVLADLDTVVLRTTAGWSMAGRFVTADGFAPDFGGRRPTVRASLLAPVAMQGIGSGDVDEQGGFLVKAIVGPARLVATVPDGWMIAAVRHEGRDITSGVLDAGSGDVVSGVEIVVTDRVTAVTGQLTDERGAPLADGTVIVFAEDPRTWGEFTPFVRAVRPDQEGRYEIRGLPPGDYLAAAVDYVQNGMWNDPEYLEWLRDDARRFTLGEGGTQALSLRVIR